MAHPELHQLLTKLETIYDALLHFRPLALSPPILDSSASVEEDKQEDGQWLKHEGVPGIKKLRESIKYDIDILQKFLTKNDSEKEPPISTHAPYLLAVYNEILCAPPPVISVFKFVMAVAPKEPPDDEDQAPPVKVDAIQGKGKKPPPKVDTVQGKEKLSKSARKAAGKANLAQNKGVAPADAEERRAKGKRLPTTKVDVVAENGKRWIRINTIKTSGILSEFREIDSYLTDSDSDSDDPNHQPSLAQKEFDNSVLQMGRGLLEAAKTHPVDGPNGQQVPRITMRLTRLDLSPFREDGVPNDPRIAQTVQCLRDMGIDVELGERLESEVPIPRGNTSPSTLPPITSTRQINLDLSVLVALVSDLTHAPLPTSVEEATARFLPPQQYRDWRPQTGEHAAKEKQAASGELSQDLLRHSRALTTHVLQEMRRGFLQEIHDRLPGARGGEGEVEFWTSDEARERCLRIVSRIGGVHEIRRAEALFAGSAMSTEDAEAQYWAGSRYPPAFIPLFPIRMYPAPGRGELPLEGAPPPHGLFFQALTKVCRDLLAQSEGAEGVEDDVQSHMHAKISSRLSPHAVKSMLRGAELGWTTLTTTKASVKALLREVKIARLDGRLGEFESSLADGNGHETKAALWIVDPRNLQCFV
ncbi:hypothetical protein C8F01DRAFT_504152 [Mycena amicta]|nr:hypothetical protein C8F01DRAFT_504152 [Mycena amicta]